MSNFSKAKKYYTKKEIDDYVQKLMTANDLALIEQSEKIANLEKENKNLQNELVINKKKVQKIIKRLQEYKNTLKNFNDEFQKRCSNEIVNIKYFGLNWKNEFEVLKSKYKINDGVFDQFILDLSALTRNVFSSQNDKEKIEIQDKFSKIIEEINNRGIKYKNSKGIVLESDFNLEEALNPVDSLEKIMQDLLN